MGSVYYYLAASLPLLSFEGKMPFTVDAFRQDARRLLNRQDYALLEKTWVPLENLLVPPGIPAETGNRVLDAWLRFEHGVRNELLWHRADRFNKDPNQYLHGPRSLDYAHAEEVHRLFKLDNLWEAEKILDKMKWRFLDDLAAGHYFDIEFLLVYALKLQIVQRLHEYGSPAGRNFLQELKTMPLPKSSLAGATG